MVYLYTDGSSNGGVGEGGYAWVVTQGDEVIMAGYGRHDKTTNNLMELEGAIQGMLYLLQHPVQDSEGITLVSDSEYALNIAKGKYKPQKNLESAEKIRLLAQVLNIDFEWVRGHSGHVMNEIADSLAAMAKRGYHKSTKSVQKQTKKQKRKELWKDK